MVLAADIAVEQVDWEIRPGPDVCNDRPHQRRCRMSDHHHLHGTVAGFTVRVGGVGTRFQGSGLPDVS